MYEKTTKDVSSRLISSTARGLLRSLNHIACSDQQAIGYGKSVETETLTVAPSSGSRAIKISWQPIIMVILTYQNCRHR